MKNLYSWHRGTKVLYRINKGLLVILKVTWGDTTVSKIRAYYNLVISLTTLQRQSGFSYVCLYMKACSIYVMKYVAKDPNKLAINSFGVLVSLTRSGIPRIIPSYFRLMIRKRDMKIVKAVLTVFNLYRVLDFKGSLKLSTITSPSAYSLPSDFDGWFSDFVRSGLIPTPFRIRETINPFLIHSSGPCSPKGQNNTAGWITAMRKLKSMFSWDVFLSILDPYSSGRWEKSPFWKYYSSIDPDTSRSVFVGKLAAKEEPGKVRIFAMVDAVTQWLLQPLHRAIFAWLKFFPFDATFDQIGRLEAFIKAHPGSYFYSFDLSAATDRLPLQLQVSILTTLVNRDFAVAWARLLVGRDYMLDYKSVKYVVKYSVGQPMGALSSWGMLALTHHLVIQYAASLAFRRVVLFKDYIVLGDDVVIADKSVADVYHYLMTVCLRVDINMAKGLSSPIALEFAKRFYVDGLDASPLSLKEFSSIGSTFSSFLGLLRKLDVSPYKLMQLMGRGSKSAGNNNTAYALLARALQFSVLTFSKTDPGVFLRHFVPSLSDSDLRNLIIDLIARSGKVKQMADLEKDGPPGYYFQADKFTSLPQVQLADRLQKTTFGSSSLASAVKKGLTPQSGSVINRLLLTIQSPVAPLSDLTRMPTDKLLEIYFLDVKSLSAANGQSPLQKVKARNSLLRNWESVFQSLTLLRDVLSYKSCSNNLDTVDPDIKKICGLLVHLSKEGVDDLKSSV
uniref:RNA-dependent RNA polymerase n=1 Tax=Sclerotinia sclerotiorum mitovirus 27 TaxID=2231679 RepID=A0A2Z4QKE2_9VIRU|nr:RNA-dependent RNA polymerase [Sclerotinia sclerotiorum mitovirus 27]